MLVLHVADACLAGDFIFLGRHLWQNADFTIELDFRCTLILLIKLPVVEVARFTDVVAVGELKKT